MAVTQLTTDNIGSVQRNDIDTTTTGQALATKVIAGTNINISSTGVDAGTGDATINLNTYLPNTYRAIGGSDLGMGGLYDRNELTNAYYKGAVVINITGAGSVISPSSLTNANSDFTTITGTDNTTTQIRIVVDTGSVQTNYGRGYWQPFLQYRLIAALNTNATFYNNVVVESSLDNITWYGGTGWNTSNFAANQVVPGLWVAPESAYGPPSVTYRYVRFTLTSRSEDATYPSKSEVWITQLGFRHINAPYARQFLRADGDIMYGGLDVRGSIRATTDLTNYLTLSHSGSGGEGAIVTTTGPLFMSPANGGAYIYKAGINATFYVYGNSAGTKYINFTHDNTDGYIGTGSGDLILSPSANLKISTLVGTNSRVVLASGTGVLSAPALMYYDGTSMNINGNTTSPTLKVGTMEFQSYSLNNAWLGENIYYDGAALRYRATGGGGLLYFQGSETQIRQYASGVAGAATTAGQIAAKFTAGGTVAIGGNISTTVANVSNASLVAYSSSVVVQSTTNGMYLTIDASSTASTVKIDSDNGVAPRTLAFNTIGNGPVKIGPLAGSGTRMVTTDSTGTLGSTTLPTGITRSISTISSNTAAGATAATDYVYYVSNGSTVTLPTAVGNTNRYTIMRTGTSTVPIATTSSQTINGQAAPLNLTVQYATVDLMSDGTNWFYF